MSDTSAGREVTAINHQLAQDAASLGLSVSEYRALMRRKRESLAGRSVDGGRDANSLRSVETPNDNGSTPTPPT